MFDDPSGLKWRALKWSSEAFGEQKERTVRHRCAKSSTS